jgi:hypothetical protein
MALPAVLLQGCYYCYPDKCEPTPPPPANVLAFVTEYKWAGTNTACMSLMGNKAERSVKVHADSCDKHNPTALQRWQFHDGMIVHAGSGLCLDIPYNKQKSGQKLQVWDCCSAEGCHTQQQFKYNAANRAITTKDGSLCLDVRLEDNHTVQLWECNPASQVNQQWALTPLGVGVVLA